MAEAFGLSRGTRNADAFRFERRAKTASDGHTPVEPAPGRIAPSFFASPQDFSRFPTPPTRRTIRAAFGRGSQGNILELAPPPGGGLKARRFSPERRLPAAGGRMEGVPPETCKRRRRERVARGSRIGADASRRKTASFFRDYPNQNQQRTDGIWQEMERELGVSGAGYCDRLPSVPPVSENVVLPRPENFPCSPPIPAHPSSDANFCVARCGMPR